LAGLDACHDRFRQHHPLAAGLELPVLVECDTGAQRCGVTSPRDAVTLAQMIDRAPGLNSKGL
jgi:D-serine deaminase-like pyridoxal phosphate-dependent protein